MSGRQKLERATQPNTTTHPISERRNGYIWYILQLSSAISQTKKEKNGTSAFLKKVHRLLFFNPETKKSILHTYILNVHTYI